MTEPLDVRCLPYMPLEIERLRKSKAWLRCKRRPELAFYILNLWMRAWHEVPAGSIEDDDDVLADAAMCSPERWADVREDVLHGWKTEGGRVYHSTVTDIATVAAGKLRKNKTRTEAARQALEEKRLSVSVTDTVTDPEGKGREEKKDTLSETSSDPKPVSKKRPAYPDAFEAFWSAYPTTPNMSKAKALAAWAKLDEDDRTAAAVSIPLYRAFLASKADHPVMHATTFINERRFDGFASAAAPQLTDHDWQKRLVYGRHQRKWHSATWGPPPSTEGCMVPQQLLQHGDGQGWTIEEFKAA